MSKVLGYLFHDSSASAAANSGLYAGQMESIAAEKGDWAYNPLAAEGDSRGDLVRDMAERLVFFYMRRGLRGSPNVLRWLLGREPTTVDVWIDSQMQSAGLQ